MTTATADLCGHRSWKPLWRCFRSADSRHDCMRGPADHPPPCRCRCGATTERSTT